MNDPTIDAYDRMAEEYARVHSMLPDVLAEYGRRMLSQLGPGAQILDVGCGPGHYMAWLEAKGALVTGLDLSRGMLAQARLHVQGPLVQADMRAMPFPDGAFDGVWCVASLLHLPKGEAPTALREMRRVLRSHGLLHLTLQEGESEDWESSLFEGVAVQRLFARYRQDEMTTLVEQAGFAIMASCTTRDETRRWLHWLQFLASAGPAESIPAVGCYSFTPT